jgi:hypothetical protein
MTVPAQLAAALDADFSALYLLGGLLSFRNILETEYYTHPFGNFLPGVLRHTDLTELPGPKRVIMAGTVDAAGQPVTTESVKAAYSKLSNLEVKPNGLWDAATLGGLASPVG